MLIARTNEDLLMLSNTDGLFPPRRTQKLNNSVLHCSVSSFNPLKTVRNGHTQCSSALEYSYTIHSLISLTADNICSPEYPQTYCKMTAGGSSRGDYVTNTGWFQKHTPMTKKLLCEHLYRT